MRIALSELAPAWLSESVEAGRAGFDFLCPACGRHRLAVWMSRPLDGADSVTATQGRRLYDVFGDSFESLEVHGALRCGEDLIFCWEGQVVVG